MALGSALTDALSVADGLQDGVMESVGVAEAVVYSAADDDVAVADGVAVLEALLEYVAVVADDCNVIVSFAGVAGRACSRLDFDIGTHGNAG